MLVLFSQNNLDEIELIFWKKGIFKIVINTCQGKETEHDLRENTCTMKSKSHSWITSMSDVC